MIIFLAVFRYASGAGLSQDLGKNIGYSYIGLTIVLLFLIALVLIFKSDAKGLLGSIVQVIMFTQFTRFSLIINFEKSSFYSETFQTFSLSQDPYEIYSENNSMEPWKNLGYNSSNFLQNSYAHLAIISLIFLVWLGLLPIHLKRNLHYFKDTWVLVAYYSAMDLSFSAFLQLKYVKNTQVSVKSSADLAGLISASICLLLLISLLVFQSFFVYKGISDNWIVHMIREEFLEDKEHYFYYYYPVLLSKVLLYSCLLVFTQDKPFTVPIVISIINLINCNSYTVSYIISIRPFSSSKILILAGFIQFIEIIFMYLPILYNFKTISYLFIDLFSIFLFFSGLLIIFLRVIFLFRSFNIKKQSLNENPGLNSLHAIQEVNNSSMIGENEQETNNLSGFLHTFKPGKSPGVSRKVMPEVDSSYQDPEPVSRPPKKGSYFLKPFSRAPKAESPTSNMRNEEENEGTARFVLSSCNSDRKLPQNTPVESRKLIIPDFSEIDSRVDSVDRVRHDVSHEITPVSHFGSAKRLNLNNFTVKCRIEKAENY